MNRRPATALLLLVVIIIFTHKGRAAQPLACLDSNVATVLVTASARTIDGSGREPEQTDTYRDLVLDDLQALGLRTKENSRRVGPIRAVGNANGRTAILISVSLKSIERQLTSAYLSGNQWPLRTVALTVNVAATNAQTGKLLAAMDVPVMNLAGNSTFEAVSDYLVHDFRDALVQMLKVACTEPSLMPASPISPGTANSLLAGTPRGGEQVRADSSLLSSRIKPDRHIAIVIGVSRYRNLRDSVPAGSQQLANLHYADADARAMGDLLQNTTTTGRSWEVHTFLNEEATNRALYPFIKDTFENARSDDVILLFFAGHGRPSGPIDVTLMTYDSDAEIANSGLSFDWIKGEIAKSPALQVIGFVDACHSGSSAIGGVRGAKNGFDPELLQLEGDIGRMRTVIASASSEESAYEDDTLHHGVFTYYLLQAIKGAARSTNINGTNFLVLGKIYDYVWEQVSHHVSDNKPRFGNYASQRPRSLGNLEAYFNNWPLARANK